MAKSKPRRKKGIDERWIIFLVGVVIGGSLISILPQISFDFFGAQHKVEAPCSTEYKSFEFTVPEEDSLDTGNLEGIAGEFFVTNCQLENGIQDILFQRDAETGEDIRCIRYKDTVPLGKAEGAFQNRCLKDIIVTIKCMEVCE